MMKNTSESLAISSSVLGAAILGFGIGILWDDYVENHSTAIIITGAVIHIVGMHLVQLKKSAAEISGYAKMLLFFYFIFIKLFTEQIYHYHHI